MFELFVASDEARRRIKHSLEPGRPPGRMPKPERRRNRPVRTASATALRGLADRLEPSPRT
jgi:hypothetical protein